MAGELGNLPALTRTIALQDSRNLETSKDPRWACKLSRWVAETTYLRSSGPFGWLRSRRSRIRSQEAIDPFSSQTNDVLEEGSLRLHPLPDDANKSWFAGRKDGS